MAEDETGVSRLLAGPSTRCNMEMLHIHINTLLAQGAARIRPSLGLRQDSSLLAIFAILRYRQLKSWRYLNGGG